MGHQIVCLMHEYAGIMINIPANGLEPFHWSPAGVGNLQRRVPQLGALKSNLRQPENLVFTDLRWFNFSPCCKVVEVYSRTWIILL